MSTLEKLKQRSNKKLTLEIQRLLIKKIKTNYPDKSIFIDPKLRDKIYTYYKEKRFRFDPEFIELITILEKQMITDKDIKETSSLN